MARTTKIKAAELIRSSLPELSPHLLCSDHIDGFCRRSGYCSRSHKICASPTIDLRPSILQYSTNFLSLEPRGSSGDGQRFDDDGPGMLSSRGPRHDNDYVEIQYIKILPTINEILSTRLPYMPKKDPFAQHHYPCGQQRLLDVHFRHLRYESTESIIDACYHASQRLVTLASEPHSSDYEYRMVTPRGFRYSLFRDVRFEELVFSQKKSITVRVSFACPKALRGRRLGPSKHLEKGMLVALVGFDQNDCLSNTLMEIDLRQTTEAMRPRTGNDLRGRFSCRNSMCYS